MLFNTTECYTRAKSTALNVRHSRSSYRYLKEARQVEVLLSGATSPQKGKLHMNRLGMAP